MGFRKDAWATVWSVEDGKYDTKRVRLSISRKNQVTGEYVQEFSEYCTFYGEAATKATKLKPKDKIKLGNVDMIAWFAKDKKEKTYIWKVFDFELANETSDSKHSGRADGSQSSNAYEGDSNVEDDLPF